MLLKNTTERIQKLDRDAMRKARNRLDGLLKPLGSLGRLEDIVVKLAGIYGDERPRADSKAVVVMCSDNGVTDEGISQAPRYLTSLLARAAAGGIAGINTLAQHAGAVVHIVDMGVDGDFDNEKILDRKIRRGTWNITKGPAMTRSEAERAINAGIDIAQELKDNGVEVLATGEMGIGNTTTSSAVSTVLTGRSIDEMVGRGSGVDDKRLGHKREIVHKAIRVNKPDPGDAVDVLAKLGGFDLAGLAGLYIGAAIYGLPVVVDGFISSAAALVAYRMCPGTVDFMIPSHCSAEPGSRYILGALELEPMLDMHMRLGEGTGAVLAFHLIDAALAAYNNMGTFEDIGLDLSVLGSD